MLTIIGLKSKFSRILRNIISRTTSGPLLAVISKRSNNKRSLDSYLDSLVVRMTDDVLT